MTHLGLNSAVAAAERGFQIVCYDPDATLIRQLNADQAPVQEPQLLELMAKNKSRLEFLSDVAALKSCDVIYVAPDVATDDQGNSDLSMLEKLLSVAFENTSHETTIIVLSQVPPGFCRAHGRPGRPLIYQVETLIFGQAIARALNPERYILGLADAAAPLPPAYEKFLQGHGNPPLFPMRYESAELAKIAINCCLVSAVSTANTLAEICEKIGADWHDIIPTLKADRRIGPYSYLAPGLGISGGNLERDLNTIIALADQHGTDAGVVRAWVGNSQYRKGWPLRMLGEYVFSKTKDPAIGILGLTYKENTHSVKNSPSVALIRQLTPYTIKAFDPAIPSQPDWHPNLTNSPTAADAIQDSDVLLILTAWPEFKDLNLTEIAELMRGKTVIDPYGLLNRMQMQQAGLQHITLGTEPNFSQAC